MGHVSDFNGMNTCDETDLSQAASDLISADTNLLDLPLNENFMPIYHSFPDDIYRQPHLYASNNLTSFMNNDDDRNEYFDEPLELDIFLDSNFNIDFDPTEVILENNSHIQQVSTDNSKIEADFQQIEKNESPIHIQDDMPEPSNQIRPHTDSENEKCDESGDFSSVSPNKEKRYAPDMAFDELESTEDKNEQIPKIVIKFNPESQSADENIPISNNNSSLTNNENLNFETVKVKRKEKHKHKKHKKKSRHKKKRSSDGVKNKTLETNQNFNETVTNCPPESYTNEDLFLNKNANVNIHVSDSEMHVLNNQQSDDNSNGNLCVDETNSNRNLYVDETNSNRNLCVDDTNSNENFCVDDSNSNGNLCVDENFETHEDNYMLHKIKTAPADEQTDESFEKFDSVVIKTEPLSADEMAENDLNAPLAIADEDEFQFKYENTDELSLSPSVSIKREDDRSLDEFLNETDTSQNESIPYKSTLETVRSESSSECMEYNTCSNKELPSESENGSTVLKNEPTKSSSASDLIEELNAHHQQVFEEIEVSAVELELELNDTKKSDMHPKTSHPIYSGANDHNIIQNKTKHSENDMNSQNHIPPNKTSTSPNHHGLAFQSASNQFSSTARLRTISSSSNSMNSKSSTSHRSYRKRRRSSSSSSSCSDQDRFYNRPVKFDPITQTYCDEFGREIRPSELKYYLDAKSSFRDSHSNNGSSSSSRSKSPRYKKHHRKHHKSRSGSRSHRRRRHSSSRSRSPSRSRSRRHKDSFDKKHRSPSLKHQIKRHYLDVEENMRAYEERRVMYVGDIPPDYTVEQLKERFSRFGAIQSASIKSKFTADGSLYIFGFVTFRNRSDVCQAIERGNENPSWPRFDLNFGGRRRFCNGNYTDLDGKVAEAESGWYPTPYRQQPPRQEDDFAELLRQEQKRLGMSKK